MQKDGDSQKLTQRKGVSGPVLQDEGISQPTSSLPDLALQDNNQRRNSLVPVGNEESHSRQPSYLDIDSGLFKDTVAKHEPSTPTRSHSTKKSGRGMPIESVKEIKDTTNTVKSQRMTEWLSSIPVPASMPPMEPGSRRGSQSILKKSGSDRSLDKHSSKSSVRIELPEDSRVVISIMPITEGHSREEMPSEFGFQSSAEDADSVRPDEAISQILVAKEPEPAHPPKKDETAMSVADSIGSRGAKSSVTSLTTDNELELSIWRYIEAWQLKLAETRIYKLFHNFFTGISFRVISKSIIIILLICPFIYFTISSKTILLQSQESFKWLQTACYWIPVPVWIAIHFEAQNLYTFTLSAAISHYGVKLTSLYSGTYANKTPGYRIRQMMFVLSFIFWFVVITFAYELDWSYTPVYSMRSVCALPSYSTTTMNGAFIGPYLEGEAELVSLSQQGIPFADGIAGGFGAWPKDDSLHVFSINAPVGVGYVIKTQCVSSALAGQAQTTISAVQSTVNLNVVQGNMTVAFMDAVGGHSDICNFTAVFGKAYDMLSLYKVDQLHAVRALGIERMRIGKMNLALGQSSATKFADFSTIESGDYGVVLASKFQSALQPALARSFGVYNGRDLTSILNLASHSRGVYNESLMWEAMASTLGGIAKLAVETNDAWQATQCDFYVHNRAGYASWVMMANPLNIVSFLIIAAVLFHLAWVYLYFKVDFATQLASRAIANPLRFLHDTNENSKEIFHDTESHFKTLDYDLKQKLGDVMMVYGGQFENSNDAAPNLVFGQKEQVITLDKLREFQNSPDSPDPIPLTPRKSKTRANGKAPIKDTRVIHVESETDVDHWEKRVQALFKWAERTWEWITVEYQQTMVFIHLLFLIVMTSLILTVVEVSTNRHFTSKSYFSGFQLLMNSFCHILLISTYFFLRQVYMLMMCAKATTSGVTFRQIFHVYNRQSPGFIARVLILMLTLSFVVLVALYSKSLQWLPIDTAATTDSCLAPTTNFSTVIQPGFLNGLGGGAELSKFAIPLTDGIIGGWNGWPTVYPTRNFTLHSLGIGFAITTLCFTPVQLATSVSDVSIDATKVFTADNVAYGQFNIQWPPNMLKSTDMITYSSTQKCSFKLAWGYAHIDKVFILNEWDGLEEGELHSIEFGELSVEQDTNDIYINECIERMDDDQHNSVMRDLASNFQILLKSSFNNVTCPSPCSALHWATLEDDLMHVHTVHRGLSVVMAEIAHFMLREHGDPTECNYYADLGHGRIIHDHNLFLAVNILAGVLMLAKAFHVWWVYLIFKINDYSCTALQAMKSHLRLCIDLQQSSKSIFGRSRSMRETENVDITSKFQHTEVVYGVLSHTIGDPRPTLGFGPRKKMVL
ncbi:hypothetical protein EDD86DRAFT_270123, partial [Gorgonomyces haynaldii]